MNPPSTMESDPMTVRRIWEVDPISLTDLSRPNANAPRGGFVYDDGGRRDAGFEGGTRDCAARAIAIAAQLPYLTVYNLINEEAKRERPGSKRRAGRRSHARTGVFVATMDRVMEKLGWEWVATMKVGSGCRTHLKANELPPGRIVARCSRHYVAVIDGVVRDTHDPRRGGTRCVYGYWKAKSK